MKKQGNINNPLALLSICSGLFFLFLVFRNTGLYPSVFADEYTYSKLSRLLPMSESSIPGYIYLKLYSVTNYCGDGFLGCAKLINAVLFVSAVPFIFLISKRVASNGVSVIVTLLAVIGPINSYTAYFMPESFYFLSFWVFFWYLISLNLESGKYCWLVAGAIYAISALIKPHSIFFLPAILVYIAFIFFRAQCLFSKQSVVAFVSFILGALLAKFGISYILAGPAGLTIFGPLYGSIASSTASGTEKYIQLLLLAVKSFKGHMLVLALVYGLPLTIAVIITVRALFTKNTQDIQGSSQASQYEKVVFLSLVVILNLICVVALFTASVANSGPYETPYRLHMRYYNFALPLFYIVAAGAFSTTIDINKYARYIFGAMVAILGVYAIWTNLTPYTPSYVDSPEIRGLHINHFAFQIIGGLLVLALAFWVVFRRKGIQLYLYLALPLFVGVSSYHVGLELNNRLNQDVYDKAGIFTRQYLAADDISKVVIIGSEAAGLFRALYYLDNAKASLDIISRDADYDLAKLSPDKEWILLIGDHKLIGNFFYQIPMNGFSLVRATTVNAIDFKKGVWPGIILKARGLSSPEPWGTWSQSDMVLFEFAGPLPNEFELHLIAHAFGPNVDGEFEASVGANTSKFRLSANDEEKIIKLNNPEGARVVRIKIPNAISPKALGLSGDDRNLGIGFVEMKVVPSKN